MLLSWNGSLREGPFHSPYKLKGRQLRPFCMVTAPNALLAVERSARCLRHLQAGIWLIPDRPVALTPGAVLRAGAKSKHRFPICCHSKAGHKARPALSMTNLQYPPAQLCTSGGYA
jgi:hypothetical protein